MPGYYDEKLSAEKLRQVYEIAPPRVKQYLEAEISYVLDHIQPSDNVLELGCGYGRVLQRLAQKAAFAIGIDTSMSSLALLQKSGQQNAGCCRLGRMDAVMMGFKDGVFDVVACIQNGLSAFHVDQRRLIREALRVTRSGGMVLFSSYSERFWDDRLAWFELQAQHGLLGAIDYDATGEGVIVCKDGFRATTVTADQFKNLISDLSVKSVIEEVDSSSLFCVVTAL